MTEEMILAATNAGISIEFRPTSVHGLIEIRIECDGMERTGEIELARNKDEDDDMRLVEYITLMISTLGKW